MKVSKLISSVRKGDSVLLLAVAAGLALAAVSCKKGDEAAAPVQSGVLRATAEWQSDGSKTHLGDEGSDHKVPLYWDAGDLVQVAKGDVSSLADFQKLRVSVSGTSSELVPIFGEELPDDFCDGTAAYTAVYPAASGDYKRDQRGVSKIEDNGIVIHLPYVQKYNNEHPGSFGCGDNPMYGTNSGSGTTIDFKNLCGVLRLQLKGSGVVNRLVVKSKAGEALWGDGTIDVGTNELNVSTFKSGTSSVVLDCDGISLDDEPKTFDIVLPVGALSGGFSVQAFGSNGAGDKGYTWGVSTTSGGSAYTIGRSQISKMSVAEVVWEPLWVDMGEAGKWAKYNVGATKPEEQGDYYAWGATEPWYVTISGEALSVRADKSGGYTKYNAPFNYSNDVYSKYTGDAGDGYYELFDYDDAASVVWGNMWRIPAYADFEKLKTQCTLGWTENYNNTGMAGYMVTSNNDSSKTLFFPLAGYCIDESCWSVGGDGFYWSRSLYLSSSGAAYYTRLNSGTVGNIDYRSRYFGFSVRPVLL